MASNTVVVFDWASFDVGSLRSWYRAPTNKRTTLHGVARMAKKLMQGNVRGAVRIAHSANASARASQTVTCAQASAVDDTDELAFLGVTLALKAAPANENQFAKGASNAAMATNLAAAINAHSVLSKYVRASAAGAVVTITFLLPGALANFIGITEAGNGMTLGGATFTGGAGLDTSIVDAFTFGA